ncbi:MAG: hypothetical protein M1508_04845 [Nitrospirae bacterium]|nr:hypothetical protein [Nitrospirota bacterium]MCL5422388.1 hypothetical protein [Nitrospirota bacterium]
MRKKLIIIVLAIVFSSIAISNAYDTYEVHPKINESALVQSNVDNYLKSQLGLIDGIKKVFEGKRIEEWIKEGASFEDETVCRSRNHFHDPLKSWSSAGFKGTFRSSVIWAQDQGWFGSQFGGDWSWKKARNSFYKGLTGSSKTERDTNLADVFRAIGQVMHLVEDASVPAHVRDDGMSFQYRR